MININRDKTNKILKAFEDSQYNYSDARVKSKECIDFLCSDQWSKEQIAAYEKSKRAPITINILIPFINTLLGEEQLNRVTIKFKPRSSNQADLVDIINRRMQARFDEERLEDKLQASAVMMLTYPIGGFIQVVPELQDDGYIDYNIKSINPFNVYPASHKNYDMSDARYIILCHWMTKDEIISKYGNSNIFDLDPVEWWEQLNSSATPRTGLTREYYYDKQSDKYCVMEMQEKLVAKDYMVKSSKGISLMTEQEARKAISEGAQLLYTKERKRIHITTTIPYFDVLVVDEDDPFGAKDFNVFSMYSYDFEVERSSQRSLIYTLLDTQRIVNKSYSQIIDFNNQSLRSATILSSSDTEARQILESKGNQPDVVVPIVDMSRPPQRLTPQSLSPEHMTALTTAVRMADRIAQSPAALRGESERSGESNQLFQSKQAAASASINPYFKNISKTRESIARYVLDTFPKVYPETNRVIQVKMDDGSIEETVINLDGNEVDDLNAMIVRSEGQDSKSAIEQRRNEILSLINSMPPELVHWTTVMKQFGVPGLKEWTEYIESKEAQIQNQLEEQKIAKSSEINMAEKEKLHKMDLDDIKLALEQQKIDISKEKNNGGTNANA